MFQLFQNETDNYSSFVRKKGLFEAAEKRYEAYLSQRIETMLGKWDKKESCKNDCIVLKKINATEWQDNMMDKKKEIMIRRITKDQLDNYIKEKKWFNGTEWEVK